MYLFQEFSESELKILAIMYQEIAEEIAKTESSYNQHGALYYFKESLSIQRRLYADEPYPDLIQLTSIIGRYYCRSLNLSDKKEGIMFQLKAIDLYQKLYGVGANQEFKMAIAYSNLGVAYAELGDKISLEKNIDFQFKALSICDNVNDENSNLIKADIYNNQAVSYINIGGKENMDTALELIKKSLNIYLKKSYEVANLQLAKALNNLGIVYQYLSDYDVGRKEEYSILNLYYAKKALSMREQIYDNKPHKSIIESLNDLSIAHIHLGSELNLSKGYCLLQRALEMCESLYITDNDSLKITVIDNLSYIEGELAEIKCGDTMEVETQMQEASSAQSQNLNLDYQSDQSLTNHDNKSHDISLIGDTMNAL